MNGRLLHVGQLSSRDHMSHMCAATKGSFVFNTNIYDKLWIPFVLELAKLSVTFSLSASLFSSCFINLLHVCNFLVYILPKTREIIIKFNCIELIFHIRV